MTAGAPPRPSSLRIVWRRGESALLPYVAEIEGRRWEVRVNDFPEESLYTLLIEGEPAETLEAWPEPWVRPPS